MTYFDKNFDLAKFLQFVQVYINDRKHKKFIISEVSKIFIRHLR